ncbi:MAG: Mov34/MPN/PAD-1 family protein [bacterium]|nr:Mov34/MPN/PAD-1 family protein [bacterium]
MLENDLLKRSNILEVKIKNYGECGFCSDLDNQETLKIPWDIWSQWLHLSQCLGSKEWGAVFWIKDNSVTRFKIPRQEVSSTDCEFKEELGGDGIVHSHHDMGAFHSTQDDRHARNLYAYSIVLSNAKGYEATKRIKLPCAGFGYVRVELRLVDLPDVELSKITERPIIEAYIPAETQDESPCEKCATGDCGNCKLTDVARLPCDNCVSLKCKECQFTFADTVDMFPFCSLCEDGLCNQCDRLAKYLENYPDDKKCFEHLLVGKT